MSIIDTINKTNFSKTEEVAIHYIINQGYGLNSLTLKQMAENSFTSPATFVRVSKRLGFKGWNEFKEEYLKEISYFDREISAFDLNIPFNSSDTILSIANKISKIKKDALDDTIELLSYKELSNAVELLHKASEIKIFASSVNILLAQEFQFKMNRIQKKVSLSCLEGEHIYDILNMSTDSVAIVISYSGNSKKMEEIVNSLVSRNIKFIAISSLTENILTKSSGIVLNMATREKLYSKIGQYSTNTSILQILDILYSSVFAKNFDSNLKHLLNTSKIANYRSTSSKLMEEGNDTQDI